MNENIINLTHQVEEYIRGCACTLEDAFNALNISEKDRCYLRWGWVN